MTEFIGTKHRLTTVLETQTGKTYTEVYTRGIAYNVDKGVAMEYVSESDPDETFIILRKRGRDSLDVTRDLRNPYEIPGYFD